MSRINLVVAALALFLSISASVFAAEERPGELHVLSSNASRPAISELIPLFEKGSAAKVQVQYANNPILKQQIEAGAEFDVVIIEPQMLMELATAGFVVEESVVALAAIGMALVSRAGAPVVDTGSVDSFRMVLLEADSIAYTADGHSGAVFLGTLEKIGVGDELKPKLMPIYGRLSTLAVAEGSAQYTAFPLAGSVPGVQLAGKFPEEIQTYIGIAAAVSSRASNPAVADTFLKYLQSDSATRLFESQGFKPSPTRPQ